MPRRRIRGAPDVMTIPGGTDAPSPRPRRPEGPSGSEGPKGSDVPNGEQPSEGPSPASGDPASDSDPASGSPANARQGGNGAHGGRHLRTAAPRRARATGILVALASALVLALVMVWGVQALRPSADDTSAGSGTAVGGDAPVGASDEGGEAAAATQEPGVPANTTQLRPLTRIEGEIRPKSVVANGHGLVIANNMIYEHTMTVYDADTMELRATVPDSVDLADHGFPDRSGRTQGAPVEAAWTQDGRYAYVSQYSLTGPGSGAAGTDACSGGTDIGRSALFRYDSQAEAWDQVIQVGRVPKFVALSPDGTTALVSNWCDKTVSVVDLAQAQEVATIPVDSAPRGIVILPDNRTAYVAAMYADELYRLDLETETSELILETGRKPRHLVLSADASTIFMTEAGADRLVELDAATGQVRRSVATGREPRSMDISADGRALYVVNYYANTLTKFDSATLEELQTVDVGVHPVGVTYEPTTQRVWVANYHGSIDVLDDSAA